MPASFEIKGLDALLRKFKLLKPKLETYVTTATEESANYILDNTVGLRLYPPETAANRPPTPYYIRGVGTQYKSRNDYRSQQLGSRWVLKKSYMATEVSNTATYSPYVHGDRQAARMAKIGWVKTSTAFSKAKPIILRRIDEAVKKVLRLVGLA